MIHVLLVEDDEDIARIIRFYLSESKEYTVTWVKSAEEASASLPKDIDIVLLDIMLPEMDGLSLCIQIRNKVYCPIILSAAWMMKIRLSGLLKSEETII